MNILCIAAHPDDEVLGCGATLARLSREGHAVRIAILGEGITSRYGDRHEADRTLISSLQEQAHAAAAILGAQDLKLFDFPDNRFDTVPLLDIVKTIEQLIADTQPEAIYAHHGGDLNVDHGVVHRAVLTACRPVSGCPVREVYAFEVPSSSEWAFQSFGPFRPNVFVDIAGTMNLKIQAMQAYESEARPFPHPRSPEALCAYARRWGSVAGLNAAEAFELIRSVRP